MCVCVYVYAGECGVMQLAITTNLQRCPKPSARMYCVLCCVGCVSVGDSETVAGLTSALKAAKVKIKDWKRKAKEALEGGGGGLL